MGHLTFPLQGIAKTTQPVIFIDTDMGSDVDDALAILTLLGRQEFHIAGISTVNGQVQKRAKITLRLLELAGYSNIPVAAGVGTTLLREKQPRNRKRQLAQYLDQEPEKLISKQHGVDLMIQSIHEHPGLTVLAIGPLTNVALAIIKDPSIVPKIGQLVVVGGAISLPPVSERGTIFVDYKSEYNLNSDPDAAKLVFNSGVPILMSGLTPALQVTATLDDAEQWKALKTPLAQWISQRVFERLESHQATETHLGDVLGAVMASHPKIGEVKVLPIHIEMWGDTLRTVIDSTGSGRSINVVLKVNSEQFNPYFKKAMDAILKPEDPLK